MFSDVASTERGMDGMDGMATLEVVFSPMGAVRANSELRSCTVPWMEEVGSQSVVVEK